MNTSTNLNKSDATRTRRTPGRLRTIVGALFARWPTVVGLAALTANSAGGIDAHITAMIIILAAMCYLAAAAGCPS